jgi:hypothetical protein
MYTGVKNPSRKVSWIEEKDIILMKESSVMKDIFC